MFPELPDARMDTRKPIAFPQVQPNQISKIMAERNPAVNEIACYLSRLRLEGLHREPRFETGRLAGEAGAVERETIQWAEHGHCDLLRPEEFLRQRLHLLAGYGADGVENFV